LVVVNAYQGDGSEEVAEGGGGGGGGGGGAAAAGGSANNADLALRTTWTEKTSLTPAEERMARHNAADEAMALEDGPPHAGIVPAPFYESDGDDEEEPIMMIPPPGTCLCLCLLFFSLFWCSSCSSVLVLLFLFFSPPSCMCYQGMFREAIKC
jgi:hypothetical protein